MTNQKAKSIMILMGVIFGLMAIPIIGQQDHASKEVVKIGYLPGYVTLVDQTNIGYEGYGYELFKQIEKYTDTTYDYIPCKSWEEGYRRLEKGEIDLLGPVGMSKDRLNQYEYPKYNFGYEPILLVANRDADISYNDYETIQKSRIGVKKDTAYRQYIDKYAQEHKMKFNLIETSHHPGQSDFKTEAYDIYLTGAMSTPDDVKVVANLGLGPFYYIAKKGNTDLINDIDRALETIYNKDFLFTARLYEKYYGSKEVAKPQLSKRQIELIKEKQVFTIAYAPHYPPLQYTNEQGEPDGISVDIINSLARDAGIELKYVPVATEKAVIQKDLDLNLIPVERRDVEGKYYFTKPYLDLPLILVGESLIKKTDSYTIGTVLDYTELDIKKIERKMQHVNIKRYVDVDEMIQDLHHRKISHILADSISGEKVLAEADHYKYSIYPLDLKLPFAIEVNSRLGAKYVEVFDTLIERLDRDTINHMVIKEMRSIHPQAKLRDIIHQYKTPLLILLNSILGIILWLVIRSAKYKREALLQIINEDKLTGLLTEYKFLEEAKKILGEANPREYLIIAIDIDNFKYINEVYGYEKGSLILEIFSKALKAYFKEATLIGRTAADNFIILIKKEAYIKSCCIVNEENYLKESTLNELLGTDYKFKISQGIYDVVDPKNNLNFMINCAHKARQHGKGLYASTTIMFTEEMQKQMIMENEITAAMAHALKKNAFKVCYQPKINLKTNQIEGAEALVRWQGEVQFKPIDFIPVFEKTGFITKLDYYVVEQVCLFIHKYKDKYPIPKIAVNLSAITLLKDDLIHQVVGIVKKHHIHPQLLEIEITESAIIEHFEEAVCKITNLKHLGFSIAMDDFGTGISSLNRLKDIHVDTLKIDRDFLSATLNQEKAQIIIENIVRMAKQLNLTTVTEGVETKEHVELLKKYECDLGQGYHFAKPMFEEDFLAYLSSR